MLSKDFRRNVFLVGVVRYSCCAREFPDCFLLRGRKFGDWIRNRIFDKGKVLIFEDKIYLGMGRTLTIPNYNCKDKLVLGI